MLMNQDFARAQVAYRQQRIAEDIERTSRWGVRRKRRPAHARARTHQAVAATSNGAVGSNC
jgi:hypothetical protein